MLTSGVGCWLFGADGGQYYGSWGLVTGYAAYLVAVNLKNPLNKEPSEKRDVWTGGIIAVVYVLSSLLSSLLCSLLSSSLVSSLHSSLQNSACCRYPLGAFNLLAMPNLLAMSGDGGDAYVAKSTCPGSVAICKGDHGTCTYGSRL